MCLIITGSAAKVRETLLTTPALLADIVDTNKDGIGSMFASDDGTLVVNKIVPATFFDAVEFIKQLPESDRDLALHFRMRTHGDVDLTNCHPYPVIDGEVHMMHNGVIRSVDDKSDKTKSDTWHYIDQVVRPLLETAPQLLTMPSFHHLVTEDIGSGNKFVLMDKNGQMVTLNKKSGIEHDGMWFSNTYAWSPEILIPDYRSGFSGYYGNTWGVDDESGYGAWDKKHNFPSTGSLAFKSAVKADDVWEAVNGGDADATYRFLDSYPISTLTVLFEKDSFTCSVDHDQLSTQDAKIVGMVEGGEQAKLAQYCKKSAGRCRKVAEVIAWYGFWAARDAEKKEEQPNLVVVDGDVVRGESEATHEVIEGQVVPIKSESAQADNPDDADTKTWRAEFSAWLDRQGKALTGAAKQPAKWTAQTPALVKPAEVAPIKSRSIMYRGYRIEVPLNLLQHNQWGALKDHLEKEAQKLHDQALAKAMEAKQQEELPAADESSQKDEAHNEAYAG